MTAAHRAPLSIDVDASFAVGASDGVINARALDCEDITEVGGGLCTTLWAWSLHTTVIIRKLVHYVWHAMCGVHAGSKDMGRLQWPIWGSQHSSSSFKVAQRLI